MIIKETNNDTVKVEEEITEENGSNTYSAIHSYGINFDYLWMNKKQGDNYDN